MKKTKIGKKCPKYVANFTSCRQPQPVFLRTSQYRRSRNQTGQPATTYACSPQVHPLTTQKPVCRRPRLARQPCLRAPSVPFRDPNLLSPRVPSLTTRETNLRPVARMHPRIQNPSWTRVSGLRGLPVLRAAAESRPRCCEKMRQTQSATLSQMKKHKVSCQRAGLKV